MEIQPNGRSPLENSFMTVFAQQLMLQNTQSDFSGSPQPTPEFSFDGYRIAGFENHFGPEQRYIKPEDKTKAFQIVLAG